MLSQQSADKVVRSFTQNAFFILLFLLVARLIAMYFIPLNDHTESRYGEISRIMLETGNWITPMQEYGVPFWAKPPLSTWLSAASMYLFGVNEFAIRLPALLLSFAMLWVVWYVAKIRSGKNAALTSVVVLASTIYFYLDAGTVMTDPSLLFATTFITLSFWLAVELRKKLWGYLFFVFVGIGFLAKGPISVVLPAMPIGLWVLMQKKWADTSKYLPWGSGLLISLLIALPWYLMAEHATPGFIKYFLVGENLSRFLVHGWSGDKYGFAHAVPYGIIWGYAFLGIFPWSVPMLIWGVKRWREIPSVLQQDNSYKSFLLFATLSPLIFFTFARNVLYTYVFTSLPFFALLFADILHKSADEKRISKYYLNFACITGVAFLVATYLFVFNPSLVERSQKRVVELYNSKKPTNSQLIYWADNQKYSAKFYSGGKSLATGSLEELSKYLHADIRSFIAGPEKQIDSLPRDVLANLQEVGRVNVYHDNYLLMQYIKPYNRDS